MPVVAPLILAAGALGTAGTIAAVGLGVAAVGTGYSIYAGERANKQQKKANNATQARNDLSNARERRDAIRQARVAYGASSNSAENQGVGGSSSSQGGLGSISSQLSSNLSFLDQYSFLTDQASTALGKAAEWKTRQSNASEVAGLGMAAFNNSDAISKVFKAK